MDNITKIFVKRENVLLEHGDYYIDPSVSKKLTDKDVDIKAICKKYGIKKYTVNSDGSIDVDGNVNISGKGLSKLPLKFRNVTGGFDCSYNKLTSLSGSPDSVEYYACYNNKLTTLDGISATVRGDLDCYNNNLITLKGCPSTIGGSIYCDNNDLTTLVGIPKSIGKSLSCDNNELTSFKGGPTTIGRNLYCNGNKLTSLDGLPTIGGEFECDNIEKLWNASSETFKASHAKDAWAIKNKLTVSK